jgi:hypothetical protein
VWDAILLGEMGGFGSEKLCAEVAGFRIRIASLAGLSEARCVKNNPSEDIRATLPYLCFRSV